MIDAYSGHKKIRVMYLASNPEWAGAEVHLATLADSMRDDGRIDVSVCVFHNGRLVDYLKAHGIKVNVLPLKFLFDVSVIFKLAKLLKEEGIDILHTHGYKSNVIGVLASRLNNNNLCVRTEHGLTEPFFGINKIKMSIYEYLDYLSGRFMTNKIISVSSEIKKNVSAKYPKNKIEIIYNGIDVSQDDTVKQSVLKNELGISCDSFIIGIVGRMVPVKGHEYFISAAQLILEKRSDVRFLIVGDGPLRQEIQSNIPASLSKYIKFTGFRNDAKDVINIMDIIVFSSLSEGVPYVLLEAMAAKKAVVATRVGGLAEVILDGKNGLLVDSKDAKGIAEKCLYLLENKNIIQSMGEEARKTVRDNFSKDKMKEKTICLYEEVIRNK